MSRTDNIYISVCRKGDATTTLRKLRFIKAWKLEDFAYTWQKYMRIADDASRWYKLTPGYFADMLDDYMQKDSLVWEMWCASDDRVSVHMDAHDGVRYFTFTSPISKRLIQTACLVECLEFAHSKFPTVHTPQVVPLPYSGTIDFIGVNQRLCYAFQEHMCTITLGEQCGVRIGSHVPRVVVGEDSVVSADIVNANVTAAARCRVFTGAYGVVEITDSDTKVRTQHHSTVFSTNQHERELRGCDIETQHSSVVSLRNPYGCVVSVGSCSTVLVTRSACTNQTLKFILRVHHVCRVLLSDGVAFRNTRVELQPPAGFKPGTWYSVVVPFNGKATFTKIKIDSASLSKDDVQ